MMAPISRLNFRTTRLACLPMLMMVGTAAANEITSVTPDRIQSGNFSEVVIQTKESASSLHIALTPGGPFLKGSIPGVPPLADLERRGTLLYLLTVDKGLISLDLMQDPSPSHAREIFFEGKNSTFLVNGKVAYVARIPTGVKAIELGHVEQSSTIPEFLPDRTIAFMALSGDTACFISQSHQLLILDISNPRKPKLLSEYPLEGPVKAVFAKEGYCYLAQGGSGISIIDIRNPDTPLKIASYNTTGTAEDIEVEGDHAYIADGKGGLVILNISDPKKIRWVGSHNSVGRASRVRVDGERSLIQSDQNRLMLLNTADPRRPQIVSTLSVGVDIQSVLFEAGEVTMRSAQGVLLADFQEERIPQTSNEGLAYGGVRRSFYQNGLVYVADWFSGVHLFDVSNPNKPMLLSSLHTPGSPKGIVVRDDYAYVADDDHGIQIINIEENNQPKSFSNVKTPGLAYTMRLQDDHLFVASHRAGFHILDVSDVHFPRIIGGAYTPGRAWGIELVGDVAVVADDSSGVILFDVSDVEAPLEISRFDPSGQAEDVTSRDHLVFATFFDQGLYILDIADPLSPKLIGHVDTPGHARGIDVAGDYAYVADWEAGVQVIDISDLSSPRLVGNYDTAGASWGVEVEDGFAYVMDWSGGLLILDILDPQNPRLAGRYHGRGELRDLSVNGRHIYIAHGTGGLQIFDIQNSLNPMWIAGVDLDGTSQSVWIDEDYAYVASGKEGFSIIDIFNPFQPRHIAKLATSGSIDLIRVFGHVAFAGDYQKGLFLVDVSDRMQPRMLSFHPVRFSDFWVEEETLFVATQEGLETINIANPSKPEPEIRWATEHSIRLVRPVEDFVFLIEDQSDLVSLIIKEGGIEVLSRYSINDQITDLKIRGDTLFATTHHSGLISFDITNPAAIALKQIYPDVPPSRRLDLSEDAVFLAMGTTLKVLHLLPETSSEPMDETHLKLFIPDSLPPGAYHMVVIKPDGERVIHHNALILDPALPTQTFSLEDYHALLKEKCPVCP